MSTRHLCVLSILAGCQLPPPPDHESSDSQTADTSGSAAEPDAPQLAECAKQRPEVERLLTNKCAGCHDNGNNLGGLGNIGDLNKLLAGGLVVPGKSADSLLYQKVESKLMPQGGPPLDDAQLTTLREWIDVCTLTEDSGRDPSLSDPPACPDNVPRPLQEQIAAIRNDIVLLDAAEAKATRYLSLAHLQGTGYCEEQIDGYRHALNKLLNHVSLSPNIRTPVAIDDAKTIYRINLFDYGWSAETWKNITDTDPYAITLQSEDARDIQDLAEVELFSVKADWFLDAASQPPLYYTILELPGTRAELEAQLGINVDVSIDNELSFDRDEVVRAGFQHSKVSFSNRIVERHQLPSSPDRAYWISYDFAEPGPGLSLPAEKNILESPLDFVEDGGEIIFNLANGLQGYMLVNALGVRLDSGPTNVVQDHETPEESTVINGLSCMSCHSEGMRLATDEIAAFVLDNPDFETLAQEQVASLYAPAEVFNRLQQKDIATFVDAMTATGAQRLVGDREPVMAAHLAFDRAVDLRRAAAEFGVREEDLVKNLKVMKGLTTIDRATVTRDTFQENFAFNACALKLGNTTVCPADISGQ